MDPELAAFLDAHPAHCEVRDDWPLEPVVPLLARLGLSDTLPPVALWSSVLAIVTPRDDQVLFVHPAQPTGTIAHVLIGGRAEPGERPEETLAREVAEETGWRIGTIRVIGYRHFRHLGPPHEQMTAAGRPYPDFVQPIFHAAALDHDAGLVLPGKLPCSAVDRGWALEATNPPERPLLVAALGG